MNRTCDAAVIGAGPAGLSAAIAAADRGLRVIVVEKEDRPLKKLLISGKGRCNLTNYSSDGEFEAGIARGGKFLMSAFSRVGPKEIMDFFEGRGVELTVERGKRVFPSSGKAADIAEALKRAAEKAGAEITGGRARDILISDGAVRGIELSDGSRITAGSVLIATGGMSYPSTGSTGDGYRLARRAGHTIVEPRPGLVPIVCRGSACAEMEGLSLKNVELSCRSRESGKTVWKERGEMLFTSFGVSGPMPLTLSSYLARENISEYTLHIDLKPALDYKKLDARVLRDFSDAPNRELRNSMGGLLPRKMIEPFIEACGVDGGTRLNSLSKEQRGRIVSTLKDFRLEPTGTRPVSEAIVTTGGVALGEVNPRTMESKLVKGLYFAGEVLDADGYTGGFNMTIAFSTGAAAGSAMKGAE
ncbi:MAG: NAD(P)/FAD-dependent oxidoreductase [Oscillospiraceae bacterium]|jgi:predicted Rossmann fold flavoprotein